MRPSPAAFTGAVARFDFSRGLASQLEREGSLPVGSSRPAMAAVPPSQAVRAVYVEMRALFRK